MADINLQQFPHAATGVNAEIGLVGDAQKVSITTAIPAGTNKIGSVDVASALPAGTNIIGLVKLSDGTDALAINTNGSINIVPVSSAGTELFTAANPGRVTTSNRLLEEVYFFNATELRSNTLVTSPAIDTTKYRAFTIVAMSTLKTGVTPVTTNVSFQVEGGNASIWTGSAWVFTSDTAFVAPVLGNSSPYLLNTKLTFLQNNVFKNVRMLATPSTIPDSGSLTIKLLGVLI